MDISVYVKQIMEQNNVYLVIMNVLVKFNLMNVYQKLDIFVFVPYFQVNVKLFYINVFVFHKMVNVYPLTMIVHVFYKMVYVYPGNMDVHVNIIIILNVYHKNIFVIVRLKIRNHV